jgi:hypothetical protein
MGKGNDLPGSEKMKSPSVRIHEKDLEAFDEWVSESDRFSNRSHAIRQIMKDAIDGNGTTPDSAPLVPPSEEILRDAYVRLCQHAGLVGSRNGVIGDATAKRVVSGGSHNLGKGEVFGNVLRPLAERGYLRQKSNVYGHTAWKIVGYGGST